ncbi:NTP pyrophosphohydrolase [Mammaliicoccus sciuri]|uniref:NTP pyrophosphohydrolase n=1 Tax=Mammaliicoccus sciuri TaxID=1296 RepID=UPI0019D39804|nr:NTP pyrophosphohydrolase [Mammaliicoccus sciuri]QSN68541.1 NTP pyrophosphohydrolase [Mammaliicoccus sciuri]UIU23284.1 NTP pyrophosphohydrolase [Mammaliicoccus sciuri]UIU26190.1 NTP pyrophosphohydrolase [Mammaliicoccus sciuri]
MFQKLKKGQVVINTKTKQTGKVIGFEGAITVVEVIISQNKEEGTRTTKLERFNNVDLRPYNKPQEKSKSYNPYRDVKKFHKAFNHPVAEVPTAITSERAQQRADYLVEELVEFLWASVAGDEIETEAMINELVRNAYKAMNKCFAKGSFPKEEILLHQTDALNDVSYINYGSIVETGVNPKPIFDIIQAANMNKLGADGKPILHPETNKIMKPQGWEEKYQPEPLIKAEIERQRNKLLQVQETTEKQLQNYINGRN